MYLPKTWPSHPIPERELVFSLRPALTLYKTVTLTPVWPDDACPEVRARATIPTVQLSFPSGVTFSSGHPVPLRLTVQSRGAPALASLLIRGVEAQLAKRMVAAKGGQVVGGREIVLSKANFIQIDTSQEGLAVSYFELTLGEPEKEQSWGVTDILEMHYLIRVSVRLKEGAANFVPTYQHVSRIGVASEAWGTRERELLRFGGFSAPAIGMSDPRLELRPATSVPW